jgi:VanZ family protein
MQIKRIGFFKFWLPVILYAGFIFYMSGLPVVSLPVLFPHLDKVIHIAEYAIFGWLLARAIKYSFQNLNITRLYLIVVAASLIYGISDEFHQSFVVTRIPCAWDVLADAIGGLLGVFLFL